MRLSISSIPLSPPSNDKAFIIHIAGNNCEVSNGHIYLRERLIGTVTEAGQYYIVLDGMPFIGRIEESLAT